MSAVASFQGVKVVSKVRAAKANVRAAPVANLQKASKVRAPPAAAAAPGRRPGAPPTATPARRGPQTGCAAASTATAVVAGVLWGGSPCARRTADRRPVAAGRRAGRLIGVAAARRRLRGLGWWRGTPFCSPNVGCRCAR
jgi:hypothetical protein